VLGITLINLAIQTAKIFMGYDSLLGLTRLFDINNENSVPVWYSSATLLLCSFLLWLISATKKRQDEKYINYWRGLSIIFLLLSIDETASIHELLIPFGSVVNTSGFLYFFWVVPGIVFVLSVALIYLKFLMALPTQIRRLFLAAGIVYVLGAVGLEMVGGHYFDSYIRENLTTASAWTNFSMASILAVEEFLEMLGILIFIYALLSYIKLNLINIEIFSREHQPSPQLAQIDEFQRRNSRDK
jgi:hypothetical protein